MVSVFLVGMFGLGFGSARGEISPVVFETTEVFGSATDRVAQADEVSDDPSSDIEECRPTDFLTTVDSPGISGAAFFEERRRGYLLLVSDSGARGAGLILSLDQGEITPVTLPLGEMAGDDIEGLSGLGDDLLVGLTSSGFVRVWQRDGFQFTLEEEAYEISRRRTFVCNPPETINCQKNWEGICLYPQSAEPDEDCVGFAVSKADGRLYCLSVNNSGNYMVNTQDYIEITGPERLSGCSFGVEPPHILWVGSNTFDEGTIWRITDYQSDRRAARIERSDLVGPGFPEALVAIPDGLVSCSDTGSSPSEIRRFLCQ